jgi:hypothetical protein
MGGRVTIEQDFEMSASCRSPAHFDRSGRHVGKAGLVMLYYNTMKRELPILKGRLTRAKKKGPEAVIAAVDEAFARFDVIGWPDNWPLWQIARDDAVNEIRAVERLERLNAALEERDALQAALRELEG